MSRLSFQLDTRMHEKKYTYQHVTCSHYCFDYYYNRILLSSSSFYTLVLTYTHTHSLLTTISRFLVLHSLLTLVHISHSYSFHNLNNSCCKCLKRHPLMTITNVCVMQNSIVFSIYGGVKTH